MISTNNFKKGLNIIVKGKPYTIIDFHHIKPGKGNQFTRTKLRHIITHSQIDLTIRSGEKFAVPDVTYKDMSFLYKDGDEYYFMDNSSYEQLPINKNIIKSLSYFLIENILIKICFLDDQAVGIELPKTIALKITQTNPGLKGNTVANATKAATLETGLTIQVPLHLNTHDTVKVNTSDNSYIEKVKIKTT